MSFLRIWEETGVEKCLVEKARRILAAVLITALCICNMAVPAFAEEAVAASFRLYRTEGTVTVQNQNGKEITAMQDMKLFNGYQLETAQQSYAWFEADSAKLFKMDAVSNLEVRKKGKKSELLLNSGNLFFNVTEHLQDDEVLNIRTSSMVVGIRGTSGWVKVIDQFHTILYMLDGTVDASVTDPVSGQKKSIRLRGGQRAEFWVYDKNKQGDKCDIIVRQFGEEEIDGFVAVELKKNQQLQDRIRGGGSGAGGGTGAGFDLVSTIAKAEERLKQDQEEVARKLEEIKKQLAGLAHKVDVDPVFTNNTSKSEDSGSSGGTAAPGESISDPTTLTMPVTDDTVHDYLNNKKVSVILQPGSNASDNVLTVDSGLTVPSGKSLTVGNGISADVQNGQTLQVDGHMEMEGSLTNAGTVNNTSANTLQIGGDLDNAGTLENRTGRLIVKGAFLNSGTLSTGNTVENSNAVQNTGTFTVTGGTAGAVDVNRGGTLVVNDGTVSSVAENGGALQLNGGSINSLTVKQSDIVLTSGSIAAVTVEGGSFEINGGNADNVTVTGAGTFTVTDGNVNDVNVAGTGNIVLRGGYEGTLVVTQGTVDAQSGAEIGRVEIQGGTFELNGGTVLNGVKMNSAATTAILNSGIVYAGDSTAIQAENGNVYLNIWNQRDPLTILADDTKNLVAFGDNGTVSFEYPDTEKTEYYDSRYVTECVDYDNSSASYQLRGFWRNMANALMNADTDTYLIMNQNETLNTDTGYERIYLNDTTHSIELNGYTLRFDSDCTFQVGGDGDAASTDTWLTIQDESGSGKVELDSPIKIGTMGYLQLKNLEVLRMENGSFTGCNPIIDHVTIRDTFSSPPRARALIVGAPLRDIHELIYENGVTTFLISDGSAPDFTLSDSKISVQRGTVFDLTAVTDMQDAQITYDGRVILDAPKSPVEVTDAVQGETLKALLPAPEQCSKEEETGVVMRAMLGTPHTYEYWNYKLNEIGYQYLADETELNPDTGEPYYYLMPYEETLAVLNMLAAALPEATASNAIPDDEIVDEDTEIFDKDADIIDEDAEDKIETPEKASPANAKCQETEEDSEPKLDEKSNSNSERNPVQDPVKLQVSDESEEPESASEGEPEKEPAQKTKKEPGQEPEKEKADLLHTEPSNVPDPREEEES